MAVFDTGLVAGICQAAFASRLQFPDCGFAGIFLVHLPKKNESRSVS